MTARTRIAVGFLGIALGAILSGCTSTTVTAQKKPTLTAYEPVSNRLPSASEYWFHRDLEDRAAVARSISEGKGP